jgi:hypothetical protein
MNIQDLSGEDLLEQFYIATVDTFQRKYNFADLHNELLRRLNGYDKLKETIKGNSATKEMIDLYEWEYAQEYT